MDQCLLQVWKVKVYMTRIKSNISSNLKSNEHAFFKGPPSSSVPSAELEPLVPSTSTSTEQTAGVTQNTVSTAIKRKRSKSTSDIVPYDSDGAFMQGFSPNWCTSLQNICNQYRLYKTKVEE